MDPISGYCLTCKSYGPVLEGQIKTMSNGRKRIAGSCSKDGCNGRISKIIG